jgi:Ca2+-binding EF-hand superfamily protein
MDQDGDGCVQLPEMDVRMALVLASFKKWCTESHGSCVKGIGHLASIARRRTAKWTVDDFIAAVQLSAWQGASGISLKQSAAMLHEAADLTGTRHVVAQDFAFLDTWEPTPWLCAEPDFENKKHLIKVVKDRYANLIVAWRRLFDRNNKNHVTFKEFQNACTYLQIKNAPGIWRALDLDHCGYISLKSIDEESAQVLSNFKEWAEETFGSIQFAFRVLDTTHSNAVSLPVFKRVLSVFGFPADARNLFQSLKPDAGGKGCSRDARLRLEDMKHLSSWESRAEAVFAEDDDELRDYASGIAEMALAEIKVKPSQSKQPASGDMPGAGYTENSQLISGRTGLEYGSSRSYSSMSDYFHFCKVPKEHEMFNEVSADHFRKKKDGMFKTFNLGEVLQQKDPPARDRFRGDDFKLPPSPYGAPVVFTGPRKAANSRKLASSLSLPTLPGNLKSAVMAKPVAPPSPVFETAADADLQRPRLPSL